MGQRRDAIERSLADLRPARAVVDAVALIADALAAETRRSTSVTDRARATSVA
jgi:hypothetical protein